MLLAEESERQSFNYRNDFGMIWWKPLFYLHFCVHLCTEFHMLLSDFFFPHDLKVQAGTKVKPYYTFSEDTMQLPL